MSTLMRSAGVGAVATLADLAALVLLVQLASLTPVQANIPALLAGVVVQFAGNKLLAFRDRSAAWLRQGALFAIVELGALALNALVFHVLVTVTPVPYTMARVVGSSAVYLGFSYPLWGRIFRRTA